MSYKLNLSECHEYFDTMPVPFTIVEMIYDEENNPVDFIFRYANNALADLESQPMEKILNHSFCKDLFPNTYSNKWISYYNESATQGKIYELHEYSEELHKYLKIISYPWKATGFCACILVNETELVQKQIQLDYLASYDTMTQTLNQNSYQEFIRNFHPQNSLGIIFIDINGLKYVNDSFGHQTGDFLIKLVTDRINQTLEKKSTPTFRVGGDEFLVVLENYSYDESRKLCEILEQHLSNHEIPHLPEVLASVGLSWSDVNPQIEQMIKRADEDMYFKKKEYYSFHPQTNARKQCRLWKESYRIGVERIDQQHIELFHKTEELLEAIAAMAEPARYHQIIQFLKEYVVFHFHDEEKYQKSIHYSGLKEHQKAHHDFTKTILEYEHRLIENNFDLNTVKSLAGTVTAWLIYHVAGEDKKIATAHSDIPENSILTEYINTFAEGMFEVLEKMGEFHKNELYFHTISRNEHPENLLFLLELSGDLPCHVYFSFSHGLVLHLLRTMIMIPNPEWNELARSAVNQIVTIVSEVTMHMLKIRNLNCTLKSIGPVSCELTEQILIGAAIETSAGSLDILICNPSNQQ